MGFLGFLQFFDFFVFYYIIIINDIKMGVLCVYDKMDLNKKKKKEKRTFNLLYIYK